jgi:DNA polymerase I-like protein with 3'-5' exonuclease and polymerase domains/uracil-DNA glycosylase
MLVGEAPGESEERLGIPFVGVSGMELDRMLHEAGILRSEAFVTNVCRARPPKNEIGAWFNLKGKARTEVQCAPFRGIWMTQIVAEGVELLEREVEMVKPNVIVAFGNTALWALTGKLGITKWRGSELRHPSGAWVVPTYHPAAILRQWSWRSAAVHDLRRAAKHIESRDFTVPEWSLVLRPTFEQAINALKATLTILDLGPHRISFDLETRAGHIACAGIAPFADRAYCIPFMCVERQDGYWLAEEEAQILWLLQRVLCHPNAEVVGQNLLYDFQYTYRWWCFIPRLGQDTMVSHHVAFAGLPKALDFQASIYCSHYVYWKDDGKEWDPKVGEDQLWYYNCEDAIRTLECADTTRNICKELSLSSVETFQHELFSAVLEAMTRGVRIDTSQKAAFSFELASEIEAREAWFEAVLGYRLNPRSPIQMHNLFYTDLGQKVIHNRKTGQPTLDDDALTLIATREPLLGPLVRKIAEIRSLGVFRSTFVEAKLDWDGRMRCSFNICGTETFRFSSSKNAFGSGTNLQNLPKGTVPEDPDDLELPNVRRLFIPDTGFTFFDMDLDRADLQVVVWEADDGELKAMLREGVDIHSENAKVLGISRPAAKAWVHGTNYGGGPRTMAINCGISVHEAERRRSRWFVAHPGIRDWHVRTEADLASKRCVTNRFGYRRFYFDRVEGLLPEALAWIPQSTVACVINRAFVNIHKNLREAQVLLQVHDSLAGQFPTHLGEWVIRRLREEAQILVPYEDPLIIPVGIKTSTKSWGECE